MSAPTTNLSTYAITTDLGAAAAGDMNYSTWKQKYGYGYTAEEDAVRYVLYMYTDNNINSLNAAAGSNASTFAHNHLSAWRRRAFCIFVLFIIDRRCAGRMMHMFAFVQRRAGQVAGAQGAAQPGGPELS